MTDPRQKAHEAVDRIDPIYRKGWTTVGKREAHAAIDAIPEREQGVSVEIVLAWARRLDTIHRLLANEMRAACRGAP